MHFKHQFWHLKCQKFGHFLFFYWTSLCQHLYSTLSFKWRGLPPGIGSQTRPYASFWCFKHLFAFKIPILVMNMLLFSILNATDVLWNWYLEIGILNAVVWCLWNWPLERVRVRQNAPLPGPTILFFDCLTCWFKLIIF